MGKIFSLIDRRESWEEIYVSADGRMCLMLSSRGRLSLNIEGSKVVLDFVETVRCITSIKQGMKITFGSAV